MKTFNKFLFLILAISATIVLAKEIIISEEKAAIGVEEELKYTEPENSLIENEHIENTINLLQGMWISADDEKSKIEFTGDKKIEFYDGEQMIEENFVLEETMDKSGIYLIAMGQFDATKYQVLEISETNLSIMMLPRGNILEYVKE